MLTTDDLAYLRATQELALPGSVVVQRKTYASDGMGGFSETWAVLGTVDGRIYPQRDRGAGELVAGGQVLSVTRWWATLPVGTNVSARDRLLYQSRTWEVIRVNNDQMWQTAVRCELEAYNEEQRT